MDTLKIHHNLILVLTALIVAAVLSVLPRNAAFAETVGVVMTDTPDTEPQDTAVLRRLLSNPQPSAEQLWQLERTLDDLDEELADASTARPQNVPSGIRG